MPWQHLSGKAHLVSARLLTSRLGPCPPDRAVTSNLLSLVFQLFQMLPLGSAASPSSLHEPHHCPRRGALQPQGCPLAGHRAKTTKSFTACPARSRSCQLLPHHTLRVLRNWHTSLALDAVLLSPWEKRCSVGCTTLHTYCCSWGMNYYPPPRGSMEKPLHTLMSDA